MFFEESLAGRGQTGNRYSQYGGTYFLWQIDFYEHRVVKIPLRKMQVLEQRDKLRILFVKSCLQTAKIIFIYGFDIPC